MCKIMLLSMNTVTSLKDTKSRREATLFTGFSFQRRYTPGMRLKGIRVDQRRLERKPQNYRYDEVCIQKGFSDHFLFNHKYGSEIHCLNTIKKINLVLSFL